MNPYTFKSFHSIRILLPLDGVKLKDVIICNVRMSSLLPAVTQIGSHAYDILEQLILLQ